MKIIGMLATYNDEDIIEEVIRHLISQGIELVVLDNGSTDNTFEICNKFLNQGIISLEQYQTTNTFIKDWQVIQRKLYDMALVYSPDWVLRSDSDEILESHIQNQKLSDAIQMADKNGFNLIQFDRFDFFITDDDDKLAKSIKEKLRYYSCYGDFIYRAWKYSPGITVGESGGHYPIFPDDMAYKISPEKLVLRHYSFRSKEHAEKKMKDRMKGIDKNSKENPELKWQINKINKQNSDPINHSILTKYNNDGIWNYELKYCPLLTADPPKKEDVFSSDGKLKNRPKTNYEYRLQISELTNNLIELRFRKKVYSIKKAIREKLKNKKK